jgi:hypothetical protein
MAAFILGNTIYIIYCEWPPACGPPLTASSAGKDEHEARLSTAGGSFQFWLTPGLLKTVHQHIKPSVRHSGHAPALVA